MTRFWVSLVGLLGFALYAAPGEAAPPAVADLVKAELVAETASAAPGGTVWLDAHLDIAPGWHVYWRNPGDAGLPTSIAWSLPSGFTAGAIEWPVPERFKVGDIANYGYTGGVDLLVPVAVPAAPDPGETVRLDATVNYLVCAEICIPGEAKLALTLPVGAPAKPDPATAERFAAARRNIPVAAPFASALRRRAA